MRFVNGLLFLGTFFFFHLLNGGHLHVLWQPFQWVMVGSVYFMVYTSMIGWHLPASVESSRVYEVGKIAVLPAMFIPAFLSLIHAGNYLTAPIPVMAEQFAVALVPPIFALLIFVSFFVHYKKGPAALVPEASVLSSKDQKDAA